MEGIWVTPEKYISFSEIEKERITRQGLLEERFTSSAVMGFDPVGWLGLLPDPDPVLRKTGDGIAVLRDLTADDKVISAIQSRKLGILKKKDFVFAPGHGEAEKADKESELICKNLEQDLSRVDLYNIFSQVLDAPYYGAAVVEILWRPENGNLRIENLKPRPIEWFGYNDNHEPVFKSSQAIDGEPIPFGKAVIVRHFPDAVNPYGLRLLSRCLWPIAIKKGGIQFWTTLCERFGMPWVIGTARPGADKTERSSILTALTSMVQDAVAVVSGGTEVKLHGVEGKGGDLHPKLIQFMNSAISTVLMGQTLTAEVGDSGSRALGEVHKSVLDDYREADETLVVKFMRDLGWIYQQINSPTAHHPTFRYRGPADYAKHADLDNKLYTVGVRFEPVHFEKKYDLAGDEFTIDRGTGVRDQGSGQAFSSPPRRFTASPAEFTPEQQAIEDLIDESVPGAAGALKGNEQKILDIVTASDSFDEAIEGLLELYPSLSMEGLQDALERTIMNIDMFGRWTAREETDES